MNLSVQQYIYENMLHASINLSKRKYAMHGDKNEVKIFCEGNDDTFFKRHLQLIYHFRVEDYTSHIQSVQTGNVFGVKKDDTLYGNTYKSYYALRNKHFRS